MFGEKKQQRFKEIITERMRDSQVMIVYVDMETGVQYLFARPGGDAGGMTVLVDKDGKPLLHKEYGNT